MAPRATLPSGGTQDVTIFVHASMTCQVRRRCWLRTYFTFKPFECFATLYPSSIYAYQKTPPLNLNSLPSPRCSVCILYIIFLRISTIFLRILFFLDSSLEYSMSRPIQSIVLLTEYLSYPKNLNVPNSFYLSEI